MVHKTQSRRAFLKGASLAAAPLAAAGVAAATKGEHEARIEKLQAEAAIRDLHQAWLRRVNTKVEAAELFADPKQARLHDAVNRIDANHQGAADDINLTTWMVGARALGRAWPNNWRAFLAPLSVATSM